VATPSAFAGRLSLVSLSDLLETMQANNTTGELRLKTDFGSATVWFENGQLLDAKIGSFQGEAAVFRLLGLTDGSFEIKSMPVSRSRVITQPVRALLRRRSQRSLEWKSLVEKLPPLGTVLVLDLQAFSSASAELTEEQMAVVQLVDGRRAIFEIIDDSGRDAVDVLRQIESLIATGLVSSDADAVGGGGVYQRDGREDESGIVPPSARAQEPSSPVSSQVPSSRVANDGAFDLAPPESVGASTQPPELSAPRPPAAATMALAPVRGGPKLGRYEVISRLGRGGMGTVYLARITGDGGFRRLFAIKVLRSHLSRSDEAGQMLLKEARIASRVDHPNIVSVVDVGSHEGQPYLVMDYVTGCSLADLLRSSARSSTAAAVSIILDTLAGLHAAHTLADDDGVSLDVIHHDVSPHNIMVGLDGIARLSDFGVAFVRRSIGDPEEASRGKPAYTAPERVKGGAGDRRSDVFSVGVILWNVLTGATLFDGPDIESTLENVLTRPIPPASRHGRSPETLDAVCFKALQRQPDKRYQSAEEMLVHLRKVAAAEDLLGSPSEVKQWVKEAMGHDLDVQRLSFLDAARMAREAEASSNLLPVRPQREEGPGSDASRTMELGKSEYRGAAAKWVAVGLGVLILLVAAFWPDKIKGFGKRQPATKDLSPPPATAPAPAAPAGMAPPVPPSIAPSPAAPSPAAVPPPAVPSPTAPSPAAVPAPPGSSPVSRPAVAPPAAVPSPARVPPATSVPRTTTTTLAPLLPAKPAAPPAPKASAAPVLEELAPWPSDTAAPPSKVTAPKASAPPKAGAPAPSASPVPAAAAKPPSTQLYP
jgi:serine/threonine protein kinase